MANYILSAEVSLKDKFTSKIKTIGKESEKFQNNFKKFNRNFENFEDKMKKFGNSGTSAFKKFSNGVVSSLKTGTNALEKFDKKAKNVVNKINKLGVNFGKNILKAGAVATGAGIYGVKAAGDFESLGARMNTAFGGDKETAANYFKWANNFANVTPYSNEEVIDAAVKLKSYGYDPKRMLTMIGDWAAAYGKTLDQALEAYADAGQMEFERLKEFGITKNRVLEYAKEHGDEIKVSGERVLDPQKFMDTLEKMIIGSSKDGMKNLANTLNGMFSTTAGVLKFNIAKLFGYDFDKNQVRAGSMLDRIKEKFEKFNTWAQSKEGQAKINNWIDAFDDLLPSVGKIIDALKDKFKELTGENFVDKLTKSIKEFDPKKLNDGLKSIKDNFDKTARRAERLFGVMAGLQLGKIFGVKGMVVGAAVGGFAPELIEGWKILNDPESDTHKGISGFIDKMNTHEQLKTNFETETINAETEFFNDYLQKKKQHEKDKGVTVNFGNIEIAPNVSASNGSVDIEGLKKEIKLSFNKELDSKIDKSLNSYFGRLSDQFNFGGSLA